MKAVTCQFDAYGSNYERLLQTFIESWKANSKIPLEVHRIDPPTIGSRHASFYWNHKKLRHWIDSLEGDTIFVDCDMLLLDDISAGFDKVAHIGITERPYDRYPFNGGVVFVRDNTQSRQFLEKWYEIDGQMLKDRSFHKPYIEKYAGMNQSSMGWMWESVDWKPYISVLPCATYNLCQPWHDWQNAKLIHVKSMLRQRVLNGYTSQTADMKIKLNQIAEAWEKYNPLRWDK